MSATMRLDRLLANMGYGSRREIAGLAKAGRIVLNGAPVRDADARLALADDLPRRLLVDGTALDPLPGLVLMLNKPLGHTCSHKEAGPIVYGLMPERWRRRDPAISTIGRLDKETSGLLLMTDDGALLHRIISPKSAVTKSYVATLARPLRGDEAQIFASGTLMLEGEEKPLLPAAFEALGEKEARITVSEGRYHQVRRMLAAVGNHVETLRRDRVGGLALPADLAPGAWRVMGEEDVERVLRPPG